MPRVEAPLYRERRRDDRSDLLLDVTIRAYRLPPLSATMLDVSPGGAMLKTDAQDFRIGDEIILAVRQLGLVATIAWLHDSFLGLSFHRRLDRRELDWLKDIGRA